MCQDIIQQLRRTICGPNQDLEVNRKAVWEDMKEEMRRPSSSLCRPLCLTFTDMIGVDHAVQRFKEKSYDLGGPTREMLSTGLHSLRESPMLAGENSRNLVFNVNNFNAADGVENDCTLAGKFIVLSFLRGGPGPQFFSEELYDSVLVGQFVSPSVTNIGSPHIRDAINSINADKDLEELRRATCSFFA